MKLGIATLLTLSLPAFAQQNTCGGLAGVTDTTAPVYPAIARAAHIEGIVILMVTFRLDGTVDHHDVLSGPHFLSTAASAYVKDWRANTYTGPRTCPIVIRYVLQPARADSGRVIRLDPQHVVVNASAAVIYD